MGPPSGTDDFVFTLIEPVTIVLSYTDSASLDTGTTLSFEIGGSFQAVAPTASIAAGDYVIYAVYTGDYQATLLTLFSALGASPVGTLEGQEAQTINAVAQAATGATNWATSATVAQVLSWIFLIGPWASSWALDPHAVAIVPAGAVLPAWWPSDDTGAATEHHVIGRYVGSGMHLSASPFPVTAWKRVA
jgi:hypothetical protein